MATAIEPSPLAQYTAFQRDVLRVIEALNENEPGMPHGLAIKEELQAAWGEEVHHGRLYPNLDQLADAGLIDKHERERDDRTNTYELTDRGQAALDADRAWRGA